jgi:hypothetical protein
MSACRAAICAAHGIPAQRTAVRIEGLAREKALNKRALRIELTTPMLGLALVDVLQKFGIAANKCLKCGISLTLTRAWLSYRKAADFSFLNLGMQLVSFLSVVELKVEESDEVEGVRLPIRRWTGDCLTGHGNAIEHE